MSSDENKMEAAFKNMVEESLKTQFEQNGIMAKLRSEMHVKVLQMMRGQLGMTKTEPLMGVSTSDSTTDRALIKVINQLIMEFFNFFGYRHTLETFRMETGERTFSRSEIEKHLSISPVSPEIPILAQLTMRVWNQSLDQAISKKVVQLPSPESPKPQPQLQPQPQPQRIRKLKDEQEILQRSPGKEIKQKKLIQNNQKLIMNDPLRKRIVGLKPSKKQLPLSVNKPDQKACTESSESELESYYSEDSEDSDAYADIPDRHVYIEELPPEGKYDAGHGEEGPYDAKQNFAENLFQRYQREISQRNEGPSTSRKTTKPKGCKGKRQAKSTESENSSQMSGREALELQLNTCRSKGATSNPNSTRKARGTLWAKSHQDIGEEAHLAVTKPQCPETHIGSVDLNSDENSEEAEGEDDEDEEEVSD
ncbi:uncharacterized protein Dana_GF18538 [Drosophila ananassae]|uniref:Uncharacterized protein n=1 Tax=Drosophila ananassae TaxID=7217 RepID=B3M370_DROAN|nr:heat shock protein DDB_G0288861 [Drosophila ananassae]EDV43531.1 uncharacterized protein Dana_GF18538 [Drosophila ananassae]